jgi:hypothetical protein
MAVAPSPRAMAAPAPPPPRAMAAPAAPHACLVRPPRRGAKPPPSPACRRRPPPLRPRPPRCGGLDGRPNPTPAPLSPHPRWSPRNGARWRSPSSLAAVLVPEHKCGPGSPTARRELGSPTVPRQPCEDGTSAAPPRGASSAMEVPAGEVAPSGSSTPPGPWRRWISEDATRID